MVRGCCSIQVEQWTQSEVGCRINVVTTEDSVAGAQRVADVCRALAEAEA